LLKELPKFLREMAPFSKWVIRVGLLMMVLCYLLGAVCYQIAPDARDFSAVMAMAEGFCEAAPACLASGVCAGLLCDLIIKKDLDLR